MLKTILNENARLKTKLYNPIIKFVYKYMLKLFEKEKSYHNNRESRPSLYPDFQRRLLQITKWSDKKLDKQYSKFLKWVQKREDLSEEQIYKLLKDIIRLSTQIIINKSDVYVDTLLQNYKLPQLKTYYYKCLRRIARRVYENPKDFESSLKNEDLINDLENILINESNEIPTDIKFERVNAPIVCLKEISSEKEINFLKKNKSELKQYLLSSNIAGDLILKIDNILQSIKNSIHLMPVVIRPIIFSLSEEIKKRSHQFAHAN